MDWSRINYLLHQRSKGDITDCEKAELNRFYDSLDFGDDEYESYVNALGGEAVLSEKLFNDFSNILKSRTNKP